MITTKYTIYLSLRDLWQKHSVLIVLLFAALIFDTISTINFMQKGGINFEIHPLVKYSAMTFGPVTGPILSALIFKFIAGVCLAAYLRQYRLLILIAPIVTSTIAGFINFYSPLIFV